MTTTHATKGEMHEEHLARTRAAGQALREQLRSAEPETQQEQTVRLEAENRLLREQLIRLQRLSTVGMMTSMTVHELRNFLTPVISYGEMALKKPSLMPKAVSKAIRAGHRVAQVSDVMLRVARGELGDRTEFELADVVSDTQTVLAMLQTPKHKGIEIDTCIPDGLTLSTDRIALQQVLLNLLLNARAAVLSRPTPRRIEIGAERCGGAVTIEVRDNGVGIPPKDLHRIFEPFFTTSDLEGTNEPGGHGLGLTVCKLIAEYLRGEIFAEAEPGQGATFTLCVPG